MKTAWTNQRLGRLFEHYNRRFWKGKIRRFKIRQEVLGRGRLGLWWRDGIIAINVEAHRSDRQICSTVLHEMCHAAAGPGEGHGYKFWAEIEKLLRQKAPIAAGYSEAPHLRILANAIPRRFPLARRAMTRLEAQRQRAVERPIQARALTSQELTWVEIVGEFKDAALIDVSWQNALFFIGGRYGLVDVEGKPTSKWAGSVVAEARKAHRRGRRDFLEDQMVGALFNSQEGNQAPLLELYRKLGKAKARALKVRIEAERKAA